MEINQESWFASPPSLHHPLPTQLVNHPSDFDLDFLRALLWVGVLSIPVRIARWWLVTRWAQVRYLGIVHHSSDLRLHPAADDLDAHQKAVLSDDWGMGVALEWLSRTFSYSLIDHAATYLKRLEQQGLATFNGATRQRGPRKCPDFVGFDASGKLHLIECKATQQGRGALLEQLANGRGQKQNVSFPDESRFVGQRLVVGLAIAPWWALRRKTTLCVEDPSPERDLEHYTVTADNLDLLWREGEIGVLSRMLVLSGEAALLARILPQELEDFSRDDVAEADPARTEFIAGDQTWIGKIDREDLAVPLRIGGRVVRSIMIRHGVSPELLKSLSRPRHREDLADLLHGASLVPTREQRIDTEVKSMGGEVPSYAAIRRGNLFISDASLQ